MAPRKHTTSKSRRRLRNGFRFNSTARSTANCSLRVGLWAISSSGLGITAQLKQQLTAHPPFRQPIKTSTDPAEEKTESVTDEAIHRQINGNSCRLPSFFQDKMAANSAISLFRTAIDTLLTQSSAALATPTRPICFA